MTIDCAIFVSGHARVSLPPHRALTKALLFVIRPRDAHFFLSAAAAAAAATCAAASCWRQTGPETLNQYLRVSADSVAYSCGGKEVAQVCLLGTETCVASMQKKSQYTTEQSVARDMGTCSCFQENGCSAGCNAAMQSMFGGYISVADCPGDTSPFVYSGTNPYDVYGGSAFDSVYNDPGGCSYL